MSRASVEDRSESEALLLLDPDTLDPAKHYRFVQFRTENLTRRRLQGYEVVLRSEHGVKLQTDGMLAEDTADDQIRVADTVLMMCDKKLFAERRRRNAVLARDRLGATESSFEDSARRKGVRPIRDNEGEKR